MTRSKSSDLIRSSALDSSAERPGVQALASLHCWEGNVHVALKSDRVHFLFFLCYRKELFYVSNV